MEDNPDAERYLRVQIAEGQRAVSSIPVDIGHIVFNSKSAAHKYFQTGIRKYELGVRITQEDPFFRDLRALMERHPDKRDHNIGCGIAAFSVVLDDGGNRTLIIHRTDGTQTDGAYCKCITQKVKTPHEQFESAVRHAIKDYIAIFREDYFREHSNSSGLAPCQETGELMAIAEADVDHHPLTFKELFENFLRAYNIIPNAEHTADQDGQYGDRLASEELASLFRRYHHAYATLLVVHKRVNRGRPKKTR